MREWIKKYDVLPKALALAIAVGLWFYVVNVVDPRATETYRGITPVYVGSDELMNSANLMVTSQEENQVTVTVSGKRKDLVNLSKEDIRVEVDISKCKEAGNYTLPYTVTLPSGDLTITRRNPAQLEVRLDKIVSASVPIRVALDGNIADGYMADEITTTPKILPITGLQDEVAQVSYAQVKIVKKNLTTSILEQMHYEFYDADDKLLTLSSIQAESDTVEVSMPVLKLKELPLAVEILEGGGALKKNVNYIIEPASITVAGEASTIDALQSVMIGVVDLSKIQESTTLPFQITLPDNLKNISGETSAEVNLELSGLTKKVTNTTSIEIINIPNGYNIDPVTNSLDIQIRGSEENVSQVLPQNVRAVVDLASTVLSPGQHTVTATILIDGVKEVGAVGEYKVVVRVSKA